MRRYAILFLLPISIAVETQPFIRSSALNAADADFFPRSSGQFGKDKDLATDLNIPDLVGNVVFPRPLADPFMH